MYSNELYALQTEDGIKAGSDTEYSLNSYEDYYGTKNTPIIDNNGSGLYFGPWAFVLVFLMLIILVVLYVRRILIRKDRNNKTKDSVLIEVRVQRDGEEEIGAAEKMFANIYGIGGQAEGLGKFFSVPNCISFEVVGLPGEIRFFVHCPRKFSELVQKQILGSYQDADVNIVNEYNIFAKNTYVECARLVLAEESYCPLKVADDFKGDPLANVLSTLSNMAENEGIAIQMVVSPDTENKDWAKRGENFVRSVENNNANPEKKKINVSQEKIQAINKKGSKLGLCAEIRIISSAPSKEIAKMHLDNVIAAYAQYSNPGINKLRTVKISDRDRESFYNDYIYRRGPVPNLNPFNKRSNNIFNIEELAALYHFPNKNITTTNIVWLLSKELVADNEISTDINSKDTIWVGNNVYRGAAKPVCFLRNDRRRHAYVLGQTGVGKSYFLERMIIQDIYNGDGVCFIDPHGTSAENILEMIPAERIKDVIYFNAGDFNRPFGLNIMEYYSEQNKHQIVNSFISLLIKMFDPTGQVGATGPIFQQAVRNSMLTAMSKKDSTLIEVVRILQDEQWVKDYWLPLIKDDIVKRYWTEQISRMDEKSKGENLGYMVSKFDKFTTNLAIRNIIGQSQSSFDIREVMDKQKILIINLSKGIIGEENMSFLGLILVQKILAAALSRENVPECERKDFFLYVDEFQNFATQEFCSILSEARKYRLNLTIGHQYIGQLPEDIKNAVFGNVGSLFIFRCSADDGNFLETQFTPYLKANDFVNQGMAHCYTKLLNNGSYQSPFSLDSLYGPKYPQSGFNLPKSEKNAETIKQYSRMKYGRDVNEVTESISKRSEVGRKLEDIQWVG